MFQSRINEKADRARKQVKSDRKPEEMVEVICEVSGVPVKMMFPRSAVVQEDKLSEKEAAQETILSEEDFIGYATGCCKACEADVAKYVCNDGLISARREGYLEDYWASCVNANCEHHCGEGFGQQRLDWITIEETE